LFSLLASIAKLTFNLLLDDIVGEDSLDDIIDYAGKYLTSKKTRRKYGKSFKFAEYLTVMTIYKDSFRIGVDMLIPEESLNISCLECRRNRFFSTKSSKEVQLLLGQNSNSNAQNQTAQREFQNDRCLSQVSKKDKTVKIKVQL